VSWFQGKVLNPVLRGLLRSPLHGTVSGSMMLLTYTGRRSGRAFTIPVQYAREGNDVVVIPGRPQEKTWWRNLTDGREVRARLGGRDLAAEATAVTDDRADIEAGIRMFLQRFPKAAKPLGVPLGTDRTLDTEALSRLAERSVIVRIRLEAPPD
jgi:deazaflavin-dependent oxidoreductase (nitroreductase family)